MNTVTAEMLQILSDRQQALRSMIDSDDTTQILFFRDDANAIRVSWANAGNAKSAFRVSLERATRFHIGEKVPTCTDGTGCAAELISNQEAIQLALEYLSRLCEELV